MKKIFSVMLMLMIFSVFFLSGCSEQSVLNEMVSSSEYVETQTEIDIYSPPDNISENESGCYFNEILTVHIENESVREAFLSVLLGESNFLSENLPFQYRNTEIDIETWTMSYNIKTYWHGTEYYGIFERFAIVNIGDDEIPVIIIGSSNWSYLVLFCYGGIVYGSNERIFFDTISQFGTVYWVDLENAMYTFRIVKIELNNGRFELIRLAEYLPGMEIGVPDWGFTIGDEPVTKEEFDEFFEIHQANPAAWYDFQQS